MALPDENLDTLADIRIKIRRLTRSPSATQITDAQLNDYINNFVLYEFPNWTNKTTLSFSLQPNVDKYFTGPNLDQENPLYNFKNKYIKIESPVFVDGEEIWLSQDRESFFSAYPSEFTTEQIATGDGVTQNFAGNVTNTPILHGSWRFSAKDANGFSDVYNDVPTENALGVLSQAGTILGEYNNLNVGNLNYLTGAYATAFLNVPANGEPVYASYVSYDTGRPTGVLFDRQTFHVRPIPDKTYKLTLNVYLRPTELTADADEPYLAERWQYIAYGAAKKVFEDRMDMESIQMIMPELERQRILSQRRDIMQQEINRTRTIYAWNDVNKSQNRI